MFPDSSSKDLLVLNSGGTEYNGQESSDLTSAPSFGQGERYIFKRNKDPQLYRQSSLPSVEQTISENDMGSDQQ